MGWDRPVTKGRDAMKRRNLLATAAMGLMLATGAFAQGLDKVKACFVYVGPIGDGGWTFQHHDGAMQVQAAFGEPERVDMSHSITKSFLSAVVGLAVQDGRIASVDEPVVRSMPREVVASMPSVTTRERGLWSISDMGRVYASRDGSSDASRRGPPPVARSAPVRRASAPARRRRQGAR